MGTVGRSSSPWRLVMPSTADATDMGGVSIPSANNVVAPRIVGMASHFPYLLTNA